LRYSTCNYTVTLKPGLGSLKVIETDTYRSATYDFLLTFYSNHGPISYCFRDKRRFQSKIGKFSNPMYYAPLLNGFPLEFGTCAQDKKKTRMTGYRAEKQTCRYFSHLDTIHERDRRTDTGRQQRPRLCIASRGKNAVIAILVNISYDKYRCTNTDEIRFL